MPRGSAAFGDAVPRIELPGRPFLAYAAWSALFLAAYVALDAASFVFWIDPIPVKPWNPQVGLAVALICAGGIRYAPPLFVAAFAAELAIRSPFEPLGDQLLAALAVTAALTATGMALRRRAFAAGVASVAAIRDFLVIAAVGAAFSAVLYVGAFALTTPTALAAHYASLLYQWLGDVTGIVVVTPLALLMATGRARAPSVPRAWIDIGVFLLTLGAIAGLLFFVAPDTHERMFYLLVVPLIVLAMRRDLPGAALGVAAMQVAIVAALGLAGRSVEDAAVYQMLMLVVGGTTLVLGAVAGERRRALIELARRSAELRAQQQALSDAMRVSAASETASTLAHEMSQPLSAIGTYARAALEMLRRGSSTPAEVAGAIERIVAESARTRDTVQRVRDFFRTGTVRREEFTLAALVADAADAMRDRLRSNDIALSTDVPIDLPPVSGDPVQIGTVLHNLLGNASDAVAAVPAPRWIRIVARQRGAFVEVDVVDAGRGIDPSVRDALFEPLATTKPTGMGLGLSISRKLIQAHGGKLELAFVHPTTFRFTLPIHGHPH